jgi:glycosyltransferase involved in cell wall biosynthesis
VNILHINTHSTRKGGAEVYLLDVIQRLTARGHACHLAYAQDRPEELFSSIRLPSIGRTGDFSPADDAHRLSEFIKTRDPDLIHLHGLWNLEVIKLCLSMKPCLMTTHDYRWLCPDSKFYWKRSQTECPRIAGWSCAAMTLTKKCLTPRPLQALRHLRRINGFKKLLPQLKAVISPSRAAAARVKAEGYPESNLHVLPYYCGMPSAKSPRPVPKSKRICFIGRIAPYKGLEYFLKALAALPQDVEGWIMGDVTGAKGNQITQDAQSLGCEQKIKLIPWGDQKGVEDVLKQVSILVFPSIWPETLGIIGLEAMAQGVPVIGCDIGGVRDWLKHEETGFLCSPKSDRQIAEYATRLFSDESLMMSMGQQSIHHVSQHFQPETHLGKLVEIYESCLPTKS